MIHSLVEVCTERCSKHPWVVLLLFAVLSVICTQYISNNFQVDTDHSRLIRLEGDWHNRYQRLKHDFPHISGTAVIVISGESRTKVFNTARQINTELQKISKNENSPFESLWSGSASHYFETAGIYYLPQSEFEQRLEEIASSQQFFSAYTKNPNLSGILSFVDSALNYGIVEPITPIITALNQAAITDLANIDLSTTHTDDNSPESKIAATEYATILVKGKQDFSNAEPNKTIILALRKLISDYQTNDVSIRLSGEIALDYDEISAALDSVKTAGTISAALLFIILLFGVRSPRVIVAIYLSLVVGLILTFAWGILAIGSYNTISIVFLVMFVGLGVDFSIHYCLRCQESLSKTTAPLKGMKDAASHTAPALMLCALSSAFAFLSFVPTDYIGLAHLGIISASGIGIAVFISLTLIPALFAIIGYPRAIPINGARFNRELQLVEKHSGKITLLTITTIVIALLISFNMRFDYNTLALKDSQSESLKTLEELQQAGYTTEYSLSMVFDSRSNLERAKGQLLQLDTVAKVDSIEDLIPENHRDRYQELQNTLSEFQILSPNRSSNYLTQDAIDAAQTLNERLQYLLEFEEHDTLKTLQTTLRQMLGSNTQEQSFITWSNRISRYYDTQLRQIKSIVQQKPISIEALPNDIKNLWLSSDGKYLLSATAKEEISDPQSLDAFVNDVSKLYPNATGRPRVEQIVSQVMRESFIQALTIACCSIALLLLFALGRIKDVIAVFIPLSLTAVMTTATAVLIGVDLNMANILVIPLIFGLGVDNGIHVIKRFREIPDLRLLLHSSTQRAVLLSSLTTMATFGALSFSSHQGMQSIGLLLAIAIFYMLIATLFILPAVVHLMNRGNKASINKA